MSQQPQNDTLSPFQMLNPQNTSEIPSGGNAVDFHNLDETEFTMRVHDGHFQDSSAGPVTQNNHHFKDLETHLNAESYNNTNTMTTLECTNPLPENVQQSHETYSHSNSIALKPAYFIANEKEDKNSYGNNQEHIYGVGSNVIQQFGLNTDFKGEGQRTPSEGSVGYGVTSTYGMSTEQDQDIDLKIEPDDSASQVHRSGTKIHVKKVGQGKKPKKRKLEEDEDEEYKVEEEEQEEEENEDDEYVFDDDDDEDNDSRSRNKRELSVQESTIKGLGNTNERREYTLYEDWRIIKATDIYIKENGPKGLQSITQWEKLEDPETGKKLLLNLRSSESLRDRYKRYITLLNDDDKRKIELFAEEHTQEDMVRNHCLFKKIDHKRRFIGISEKLNYDPGRITRSTPYNTKYKSKRMEKEKEKEKGGGRGRGRRSRRMKMGQAMEGIVENDFDNNKENEFGDDLFQLNTLDSYFGTGRRRSRGRPKKTTNPLEHEIYEETYQGDADFQFLRATRSTMAEFAKENERFGNPKKGNNSNQMEGIEESDIYVEPRNSAKRNRTMQGSNELQMFERDFLTPKKVCTENPPFVVQKKNRRGRRANKTVSFMTMPNPSPIEIEDILGREISGKQAQEFKFNIKKEVPPFDQHADKYFKSSESPIRIWQGSPQPLSYEEHKATAGFQGLEDDQTSHGIQKIKETIGIQDINCIQEYGAEYTQEVHGTQFLQGTQGDIQDKQEELKGGSINREQDNQNAFAQGQQGACVKSEAKTSKRGRKKNVQSSTVPQPGLKALQFEEDFGKAEMKASEMFKTRKSHDMFTAKEDIVIFVDYNGKFRQFVKEEGNIEIPIRPMEPIEMDIRPKKPIEASMRPVEPIMVRKNLYSLPDIARKYNISLDQAMHYFSAVSCNYEDLEEYLAGNASVIWTPKEDEALEKNNPQAMAYLRMIKGPVRVQARREYLLNRYCLPSNL